MRITCILLSAVALLNNAGFLSAQQRVEHRRPDFAVTIPVGLQRAEDAHGNLLLFIPPAGEDGVVISVEDMGMIIGLEPLRASDLPAGSRLNVEYLPMRDIQVSVLVNRISREGVAILIMAAQIPLCERGIQISVAGREDQEQEVRNVLASVLSSFEGELVSPSAQQTQIVGVRRLSVRERLLRLSWSVILVFGWLSLLAYLPLRLALIGRKDALLGLRANWLAVSAVCLVVGSSIRMIVTWDLVEWITSAFNALIAVLVAFLVLKARDRLVRRRRQRDAEATQRPQWLAFAEGELRSREWVTPDGRTFSICASRGLSSEPASVMLWHSAAEEEVTGPIVFRVRMIAPSSGEWSEWRAMQTRPAEPQDEYPDDDEEEDGWTSYEGFIELARGKYEVAVRMQDRSGQVQETGGVVMIVSDPGDHPS